MIVIIHQSVDETIRGIRTLHFPDQIQEFQGIPVIAKTSFRSFPRDDTRYNPSHILCAMLCPCGQIYGKT